MFEICCEKFNILMGKPFAAISGFQQTYGHRRNRPRRPAVSPTTAIAPAPARHLFWFWFFDRTADLLDATSESRIPVARALPPCSFGALEAVQHEHPRVFLSAA